MSYQWDPYRVPYRDLYKDVNLEGREGSPARSGV